MLTLLLLACNPKVDLGDSAVIPDLGDPYVAIVAAVDPGLLKSTCVLSLDLLDAATGDAAASVSVGAGGREWVGTQLQGGVQYTATGRWNDCTNTDRGTGEFSSSTFSGVEGDLFVFRYDGVNAAFESLVQREDFEGGGVSAAFAEGASASDVEALASAAGAEEASQVDGSAEWTLRWTDATPVGAVLTSLSASSLYVSGAPIWIRQPEWW